MRKHLIKDVVQNSIADQLEIKNGDYLLSIDGKEIKDIFDYHLLSESENLTLEIEASDGEIWEIDIEKDESGKYYFHTKGICENCLVEDPVVEESQVYGESYRRSI